MSNRLSRRDLFPLLVGNTIAVPLVSKLIDLSPKEILPLAQPAKIITLEDSISEGFTISEGGELHSIGYDWITINAPISATKVPTLLSFEFPKKGILRIGHNIIPVFLDNFLLQIERDQKNHYPGVWRTKYHYSGVCSMKIDSNELAFTGHFLCETSLNIFRKPLSKNLEITLL